MTFPLSGYGYRPAGAIEIPGIDPDWLTVPKHEHEAMVSGQDIKELEMPVAQGESQPFAAMLFLHGSSSNTFTLTLSAPEGSLGGFMVQALNSSGTYVTRSFGADNFNTAVGTFRVGISGTLESWHPVRVEGMIVAGLAGQLRLRVNGTATVKAGSFLHGFKQHDARAV